MARPRPVISARKAASSRSNGEARWMMSNLQEDFLHRPQIRPPARAPSAWQMNLAGPDEEGKAGSPAKEAKGQAIFTAPFRPRFSGARPNTASLVFFAAFAASRDTLWLRPHRSSLKPSSAAAGHSAFSSRQFKMMQIDAARIERGAPPEPVLVQETHQLQLKREEARGMFLKSDMLAQDGLGRSGRR